MEYWGMVAQKSDGGELAASIFTAPLPDHPSPHFRFPITPFPALWFRLRTKLLAILASIGRRCATADRTGGNPGDEIPPTARISAND